MGNTSGVGVRRVGFRHGTDAELAAMHLVEMEIKSEFRPGTAPVPLESYLAFARSLPSLFDDHTWLATSDDGTPIGCSACWSDSAGDPGVMDCYVYVRPAWRRRGVGWRLATAILQAARLEGRPTLLWATFDSVPAGEAFSRRLGGSVARVNRTSELRFADLDWELVRSWLDGAGRTAGYRLDLRTGPFPSELLEDAASLHHIMQTAPSDDLEVADVFADPQQVANSTGIWWKLAWSGGASSSAIPMAAVSAAPS